MKFCVIVSAIGSRAVRVLQLARGSKDRTAGTLYDESVAGVRSWLPRITRDNSVATSLLNCFRFILRDERNLISEIELGCSFAGTRDDVRCGAKISVPSWDGSDSVVHRLTILDVRVQQGFVSGVKAVVSSPDRVISGVHYLFALVCAVDLKMAHRDVYEALRFFFADISPIRATFEGCDCVPLVRNIYRISENLWRDRL